MKREEGIFSLWKGLGPNLIGIIPARCVYDCDVSSSILTFCEWGKRSIYFSTYHQGKQLLTKWNNGVENSAVHMISALNAGFATAIFTNPIWMVKTRLVSEMIHSFQVAHFFSFNKLIQSISNYNIKILQSLRNIKTV
jgi:solute carrier family 25, member 33/36